MYSAIFILAYYGLFRVGKLCQSEHVMKAKDIHVAVNKEKILIVLYLSKMHSKANNPQKIKITSNPCEQSCAYLKRNYCPFKLVKKFLKLRGNYRNAQEQFFIFSDKSPVMPNHANTLLKEIITLLGLNKDLYLMHCLQSGRCSNLIKYSYSINKTSEKNGKMEIFCSLQIH